jgi:fibronectin type 3 domain-containing protein
MAFILVVPPGGFPPSNSELQWVDSVRQAFPGFFNEMTLGRGTMVTDISTLAPPTNLQITGVMKDQAFLSGQKIIDLAWDPYSNPQLQGYNVYRSTSANTPFARSNDNLVTGATFTDEGLDASETYAYHVTAVLTTGEESPFSNLVTE